MKLPPLGPGVEKNKYKVEQTQLQIEKRKAWGNSWNWRTAEKCREKAGRFKKKKKVSQAKHSHSHMGSK